MAQDALSLEVLEGLARAAGVDITTMPPETLLTGELAEIWRGVARLDNLNIQDELPAFVSLLKETGDES